MINSSSPLNITITDNKTEFDFSSYFKAIEETWITQVWKS